MDTKCIISDLKGAEIASVLINIEDDHKFGILLITPYISKIFKQKFKLSVANEQICNELLLIAGLNLNEYTKKCYNF